MKILFSIILFAIHFAMYRVFGFEVAIIGIGTQIIAELTHRNEELINRKK